MLKHCFMTSGWFYEIFLNFFCLFFLPIGLPLSECFVTLVYSWCSFTESAYSKMKLLLQNRGSGHTFLFFRVLGWLFLPAVKEVSIADGPAVRALE